MNNTGLGFILVIAVAASLRYLLSATKPTAYRRVDVVVELNDVITLGNALRGITYDEPATLTLPVCHEYEPEFGALGCWCGEYSDAPQHYHARNY